MAAHEVVDERSPRGLVEAVMPADGRDARVELLEEEVDRVLRQEEERPDTEFDTRRG